MRAATEETVGFEVYVDVARLVNMVSIAASNASAGGLFLTSTSSKTATTNTSRVELRQPTTTPGRSDERMSVGQNTRIKPSCSTMTRVLSVGGQTKSVVVRPFRFRMSLGAVAVLELTRQYRAALDAARSFSLQLGICTSGHTYEMRLFLGQEVDW